MNKLGSIVACWVLLGACGPAAVFAGEIEDLLAKLDAKSKALKSYIVKSTMKASSDDFEMSSDSTSWTINDGKVMRTRVEATTKMKMPGMGDMETTMLTVSDGVHSWMETRQMGMTSVIKNKATAASDNTKMVSDALKRGKAVIKKPETINGELHHVLETVADGSSTTYWYNNKTGLLSKFVTTDAAGSKTTWQAQDIKLNAKIGADKFSYSPPTGAQVTDMTK